ncbi:MAG: DUF1822 family protein [Okeania sp. SIO3H1]|uniref:DUF1822 family protein n=1 Tax=Okeania sp. SIO1I7 TaxID=2607772 RepID=UPI0013CC4ADF|nr:DUF1822 family protein [Okeania sp. SIO1I7]NEN89568.1 DUF1822 family protein [Okeania sp. SIO3H1]NET25559.1 DUF1822 family protein [Okeania sp. SIO1I7]
MNSITESLIFRIPLSPESHAIAEQFAQQQISQQRAKEVYLNTLAVYIGQDFLNSLDFETNLENADCFNPVWRMAEDVADVIIPDLGVIEFRCVLPGEIGFLIPEFVRENRLVYVAVGFDESLDFCDILGFICLSDLTESDGYISLEILQPAENLLDYLMQLEAGRDFLLSNDPLAVQFRNVVEAETQEKSLGLMAAALEAIYRQSPDDGGNWRGKGGKVLAGDLPAVGKVVEERMAISTRDEVGTPVAETKSVSRTTQKLAKQLLGKLKEIWE